MCCQLLLLLTAGLLINACKKEEAQPQTPTNLVRNGDMETYPWNDWIPYFGYNITSNPNGYINEYSIEAASSGTHSIKATCTTVKNDTTFIVFYQLISPESFKVGDKLTLKAKIKTVNVVGKGISLVIRGDKVVNGKSTVPFFATTQGTTQITGNSDFKEYTITSDAYPGNLDYITLYLIYLPQTTGTAYFDDVSLTIK